MAKTNVPCPRCRQPLTLDLTRLFDMNTNPEAKEALLSGSANYYKCAFCHSEGIYPLPVVYHDPKKELLLTYFPPELNAPLPEQEKALGPMLRKVIDDLPASERKGYLFKPQAMLTQQRLFETILEADGISPEMIRDQQEKMRLAQELLTASAEALPIRIGNNDDKIDEAFIMMIVRMVQASQQQGDQRGAEQILKLQEALLEHSTVGKKMAIEAEESKAVMMELQELSKEGLKREGLLDLAIRSSGSDVRLNAMVSLVRGALDYSFFQMLTDKIEASTGDEKSKLETLRQKLLDMCADVDHYVQSQKGAARKQLEELLSAKDMPKATEEALPHLNQALFDVINEEAAEAQAKHDDERLKKLVTLVSILRTYTQSSRYLQLVQSLLQTPDANARQKVYESMGTELNDSFVQLLEQLQEDFAGKQEQKDLLARIKQIYSEVLSYKLQGDLKSM